jgi:putative MATE family efflux protein
LASIGASAAAIQLLIGFALGISSGIAVVTAQKLGAKDENMVRKSVAMGWVVSLTASLILGGLGVIFIRPLYSLMQTPADDIDGAVIYATMMFVGAPATLFYNYVSAILRAFGNSRTPLLGLMIAAVLNIVLDLVFIVVLGWGLREVAIATLISQTVSGLICVRYALKRIPMLRFKKTDFFIDGSILKTQLKIGIPMAFHSSVLAIGSLFMQAVLNALGSLTIAAYTLANRVDVFLYACLSAFSAAATTFTAQNYGAGNLERVKHAVKRTTMITVSICLAYVILLALFSPQLMQLFVGADEVEVIGLGVMYVRINSLFYPLLGVMFIMLSAQQGLGRPAVAMCSSLVELAIRPLAAFLLARQFGFAGFRFANAAAWSCSFVMLVTAYLVIMKNLEKSSALKAKT